MESAEEDACLTTEQYLAKHHLIIYFEDAVTQLLEYKEDNSKVNPKTFFHEYFTSVMHGNHTLFRDFSFIRSTAHNRASFIRTFLKCFRQVGKNGELLIIKEYYSLVRLLCPDFPFEILQKTAKIILMDDAMDCLMSFSDFLFAFQLQFYFETFLEKCSDIYHNLLELSKSQQDSNSTNGVLDDISSSLFMETIRKDIYKKCLNTKFCCPPLPALQEILNPVTRVSFYGFLMALTKSPAVNSSIGVLPDKSCLMDFNEKDGTAARASPRPLSAKPPRPPSGRKTKTDN